MKSKRGGKKPGILSTQQSTIRLGNEVEYPIGSILRKLTVTAGAKIPSFGII